MKKLFPLGPLAAGLVTIAGSSFAGTLTFDANTTFPATDGVGTWNATTTNWDNGTTDVAWPNTTDTAAFGAGVAGNYTITLSGTINAGGLAFKQTGYTLSDGLTLVPSAGNFTISTSGGTDTVGTTTTTAGTTVTKTGVGTLAFGVVAGGSAGSPTLAKVTGGTYSAATGYYDSILSITNGASFGPQPSPAVTQFTLDAGTLRFTGSGNANGSGRTIQVASGGAIIDAGGGYTFNDNISIAASGSLYLSNNAVASTTSFKSDGTTAVAISGTGANVVWNGPGTAVFGSTNTYTGGTTVNGGTLTLAAGGGAGTVRGPVTVNPGATLSLTGTDVLGYTAGTQVTTLNVNGGTVDNAALAASGNRNQGYRTALNLTGGTVSSSGGGIYRIAASDATAPGITSNASPTTSVVSASVDIAGGTLPVNVASGTTPSGVDLLVSGQLMTAGSSLTKTGNGVLSLTSGNSYTGATNINAGIVRLSSILSSAVVVAGKAPQLTTTLGSAPSLTGTINLAAGTALGLSTGADLPFTLGTNPTQVTPLTGNITATGLINIRLGTSASLAAGTYTLFSTTASSLGDGAFQFDGASTLTIPATSQIKQVGGTFYRLTLQNSGTAAQVVVTPAPANIINVMPLGSSITEGVSGQGGTYSGGGYHSQLYQALVNDGRFTPNFVGSNTVLDNSGTGSYNVLTGANQLHHEGHGGYTTSQVLTSLNYGAKWLGVDASGQPSNGVVPDYVTLSIGGNDYGNSATDTLGPVNRTDAILSYIQTLRPASQVIVATLFFRAQTSGNTTVGDLQNTYYNPALPIVVFNHVLAGQHVSFMDASAVTPNDDTLNIGSDGIHPLTSGYNIFANAWYNALVFGSAFWTGGQDNRWSTVTAGATNFAQNYQLTTPRQTALTDSTDVYFNSNTVALPTTLGRDITIRGVNFAAGATGPVSIGGPNTLTLGAGGITVQRGTGAHIISSNVALGANQTWGNVSGNPFTLGGVISGNYGLTLTAAYTLQDQVDAANNSNATVPKSFTGPGLFVLSGANTYAGGTALNSGTLVVNNPSGSATGSGSVTVNGGATLTNNGAIGGSVFVNGATNGNGTFNGAVTVNNGGVFGTAGTVNGPLTIGNGGLLMLSGGTLNANGGVVNNGTVRLEHGAALAVASGNTFINNGVLDIITGSFTAPGGFTNNGAIIDSSVIKVNSATLANGAFTVTVNGYTGHSYQLQSGASLTDSLFNNIGAPQSGTTGGVLTFTDSNASGTQNFYRVQVDP